MNLQVFDVRRWWMILWMLNLILRSAVTKSWITILGMSIYVSHYLRSPSIRRTLFSQLFSTCRQPLLLSMLHTSWAWDLLWLLPSQPLAASLRHWFIHQTGATCPKVQSKSIQYECPRAEPPLCFSQAAWYTGRWGLAKRLFCFPTSPYVNKTTGSHCWSCTWTEAMFTWGPLPTSLWLGFSWFPWITYLQPHSAVLPSTIILSI